MRYSEEEILEKKALLEAAFFLSPDPLSIKEIQKILETRSERLVEEIIDRLRADLQAEDRGIELIESGNGFRYQVKNRFIDKISHLAPYQEISDSALRTLSIIAYNHPALQKDIVELRGKCAYSHIKELINRGLVKAEKVGRTKSLEVTEKFLEYFGLESPEEFKIHVTSAS